jgi:hypothetical protein
LTGNQVPYQSLVRGLLIVVPVYFAILLLLKGMKSVANLVALRPAPSVGSAENSVPSPCSRHSIVIGAVVGTAFGSDIRNWIEKSVFERSLAMRSSGA